MPHGLLQRDRRHPRPANRWLLTDVLRGEWGFAGYVIGDYKGVDDLLDVHGVAADRPDAAQQALLAGLDHELNQEPALYTHLIELVETGVIDEAVVDTAVARILRLKFLAGLFEQPYVDETAVMAHTNTPAHRALAQEAAEKAIILLQNEGSTLPFAAGDIQTLAVIGPNAAGVHYGGYSAEPRLGVGVLDGLRAYGNGRFQIIYAQGCKITTQAGSFWDHENATLNNPGDDERLIAETVVTAVQADAVLLVSGSNETTCREAWDVTNEGDRAGDESVTPVLACILPLPLPRDRRAYAGHNLPALWRADRPGPDS